MEAADRCPLAGAGRIWTQTGFNTHTNTLSLTTMSAVMPTWYGVVRLVGKLLCVAVVKLDVLEPGWL